MIDHLTVGAADYAASKAFYDRALGAIGLKMLFEDTQSATHKAGYGSDAIPFFWIADRAGPVEALHLAFAVDSREAVDAFHREAIAAGATDNGEPGYRPYMPGYYAAFVLDPDGRNIEAVFHDPSAR